MLTGTPTHGRPDRRGIRPAGRLIALLALVASIAGAVPSTAVAGSGDPQVRTDHPWYPGEGAMSTFPRLFATQAALYKRVTGIDATTDEHKALAAWLWRNTHYWHGEEGAEDLWGAGFGKGGDTRTREYWTGLFAHGFGLCGTTHSQWTAEFHHLLGHNRGRGAGVAGHNAFEVFLTGGVYGDGKWVLLDHDLSTVIYDKAGGGLVGLPEVVADLKRLTDRKFSPDKQNGWLVCGLDPRDGGSYAKFTTAEYFAGYAGPPPIVHLRRGETLRRYVEPGLDDGRTFVFWGRNYGTAGVPGPERGQTWVNQPDRMYRSKDGCGYKAGQARYANAVHTWRPDFSAGRPEGSLDSAAGETVLEFTTPYIIAATPAGKDAWGVYADGCRNGLVVRGKGDARVSVSVDRGRTWHEGGPLSASPDLTDRVKGHRQYRLKIAAAPDVLRDAGLVITTVCQCNSSVIPRLADGGSTVRFESSGTAVVSAGPTLPQGESAIVAGKFGTPAVTLKLATPNGEPITAIHAAAHLRSGSPPRPDVKYHVEWSADGGKTWKPVVSDWAITRRGHEPQDFWSQSLMWGSRDLTAAESAAAKEVLVRFRNTGGKQIARAEVHLSYKVASPAAGTKVTFAWTDDKGPQTASHVFATGTGTAGAKPADAWQIPTGKGVRTRWVEYEPVGK